MYGFQKIDVFRVTRILIHASSYEIWNLQYHPESNGQTETMIQEVRKLIKMYSWNLTILNILRSKHNIQITLYQEHKWPNVQIKNWSCVPPRADLVQSSEFGLTGKKRACITQRHSPKETKCGSRTPAVSFGRGRVR